MSDGKDVVGHPVCQVDPTNTVFENLVYFLVSNTCNHFLKQIMLTSKNISIYLTKLCIISKLSIVFNYAFSQQPLLQSFFFVCSLD